MIDDQDFLRAITKLILDSKICKMHNNSRKVVDFKFPDELKEKLDLRISKEPSSKKELVKLCQDVIDFSVKTNHPLFLSRLYQGVDGFGLAGAWLTEALNTTQTTYEVGPVFTMIEQALMQEIVQQLDWREGDGIFCPGGSLANMYGIHLGRFKKCPDIKKKGVREYPPLILYLSDQGHYSTKKGASFLGLGINQVRIVLSDKNGRIIPEEFEKCIIQDKEKGFLPFFLCATSGTTVLGAYDPLVPLVDICKKHDVWLHVDAAWGGTALFSRDHRNLLDGIEQVDSITWNLHKMAGIPLQCSIFATSHKGLLYECNANAAEYLFQEDKYYSKCYDTGDESIQCGRKVDSLKFWISWKAKGHLEMERIVNATFDAARYLEMKVEETEGFELVLPTFECTNVCFWFIPPSMRTQERTKEFWGKISKVTSELKKKMVLKGYMLLEYQPLTSKNLVNFFRVSLHCAPTPEMADMDFIIKEIVLLGHEM